MKEKSGEGKKLADQLEPFGDCHLYIAKGIELA